MVPDGKHDRALGNDFGESESIHRHTRHTQIGTATATLSFEVLFASTITLRPALPMGGIFIGWG